MSHGTGVLLAGIIILIDSPVVGGIGLQGSRLINCKRLRAFEGVAGAVGYLSLAGAEVYIVRNGSGAWRPAKVRLSIDPSGAIRRGSAYRR
jgi:hypothetical protein